jgi:hypothetical protein
MGPLAYAPAVANSFVWAHWHMHLLLPIASFQPFGIHLQDDNLLEKFAFFT